MLGITVLCFFLLKLVPGDAADVLAAESGSTTAETMTAMRQHFGLNQPLLQQLFTYLSHLAHFNLGYSIRFGMPVSQLIVERLPDTLLLMVSAPGTALVLGILAGWVMAIFAGRWPDRLLQVMALLFYSTPGLWFGLMAIVLFAVKLGWLPSNGSMTVSIELSGLHLLLDRASYLVLPSLALPSFFIAVYARLTRATMLEVQGQDFTQIAAAKGLHPVIVQFKRALRNALIPVTTVAGIHLGNLLAGAVVRGGVRHGQSRQSVLDARSADLAFGATGDQPRGRTDAICKTISYGTFDPCAARLRPSRRSTTATSRHSIRSISPRRSSCRMRPATRAARTAPSSK